MKKDNSKLSPRLQFAINQFMEWFEYNVGYYSEVPEYVNLKEALKDVSSERE